MHRRGAELWDFSLHDPQLGLQLFDYLLRRPIESASKQLGLWLLRLLFASWNFKRLKTSKHMKLLVLKGRILILHTVEGPAASGCRLTHV